MAMLAAIGFDDQPRFDAGEIHDVRRDWVLPAKTNPKLLLAQTLP
jgi:hypothetical protein